MAFGSIAELYDESRPSYPAALVDDVVSMVASDRDALEVGAGTGKATELFAARGIRVLAIEPSAAMAAMARRRCADYPGVVVEEREFELFSGRNGEFGLVFSAQAWHWVDPAVRYMRAREALCDGGVLALFWNRPLWDTCALRDAVREAYARVAPELDGGPMHPGGEGPLALWTDWGAELRDAAGFSDVEARSYGFSQEYRTPEYQQLLRTHSDHITLADARREALLEAVGGVIDGAGGGILRLEYRTELFLARAV